MNDHLLVDPMARMVELSTVIAEVRAEIPFRLEFLRLSLAIG